MVLAEQHAHVPMWFVQQEQMWDTDKSRLLYAPPNIMEIVKDLALIRQEESHHLLDAHGLIRGEKAEDDIRQIRGILGEWTVANYFSLLYTFSVNTFGEPDVWLNDGRGLEVKAASPYGPLMVRPNAKDSTPYVLVGVHLEPDLNEAWCEMNGWLYPYEARLLADADPRLWQAPQNRPPAIFVPQHLLRPIETLRDGHLNVGISGPTSPERQHS